MGLDLSGTAVMHIRSYDDLARALSRLEELAGAPKDSSEELEFRAIAKALRRFEREIVIRIAAQHVLSRNLLLCLPDTSSDPANVP